MKEGRRRFLLRATMGIGALFMVSCAKVELVKDVVRDRKRIDKLEEEKYIVVNRLQEDVLSVQISTIGAKKMVEDRIPILVRSDIKLVADKYFPNEKRRYSIVEQKNFVWTAYISRGIYDLQYKASEEQTKLGMRVINESD